MSIVYITGNAGSGKTTALDAVHAELSERGKEVLHVMGSSSPEAIRRHVAGRPRMTLLVDDCPAGLLHWLERPGNLPEDCRVFVTMHQLPRK